VLIYTSDHNPPIHVVHTPRPDYLAQKKKDDQVRKDFAKTEEKVTIVLFYRRREMRPRSSVIPQGSRIAKTSDRSRPQSLRAV